MDRRDRAAREEKWYESFDPAKMRAAVLVEDEDGCEREVEVPCVYAVCGTCDGRGSHVNPSVDSRGISPEEFDEDPEFAESYFAGAYDVACYECRGLRVVPAPDADHLTAEVKSALEEAEERRAADARYDAEERYTRRMESGGWG